MTQKYDYGDYVLKSLSKIRHKKWELYAVSRIIHSIGPDVAFKCQQYVRTDKKDRFFTDIYFPQFKLHLEIDEQFHSKNENNITDGIRSLDIISATEHEIVRIGPGANPRSHQLSRKTRNLAEFQTALDSFILHLKEQVSKPEFKPWRYDRMYSPEPILKKKYISINEDVAFRYTKDALKCFGYDGGHYQRSTWTKPNSNYSVWFPRLYDRPTWSNTLSDDGKTINCKKDDEPQYFAKDLQGPQKVMIVFAHTKNNLGQTLYRFVGVFRLQPTLCNTKNGTVYHRIAEKFVLNQF